MRFSVSGRALVAALVVVVACAAGGIAYASIPDAGGVIHGCYDAKAAGKKNGSNLAVIDTTTGTCGKNETELDWNQAGPAGADGVSVTSAPVPAGDVNCPQGGSRFTAAGDTTTYACNGAKGDKGDTGASGATGPAGSNTAYTNYGDGNHHLATGTTQTVATLTLPSGSYTLSATTSVAKDDADDHTHVQCFFIVAGGTLHGNVALASLEGTFQVRMPIIGDVTVTGATATVFLRCIALDAAAEASGDVIATQVGSITPSS
jgi:hypothetical protein